MDLDVIIIGAGAAGMLCAAQAGRRHRRVLLIDHAPVIGERIRVSGGGRCNFTNRHATADRYLSQNPHFCRSALARFTPRQFVSLVEQHGVPYHEREDGQLFCDDSAADIIGLLHAECAAGQVTIANPCAVDRIEAVPPRTAPPGAAEPARFTVSTERGTYACRSLVVATGGLAVPKLGATPFGYQVAAQFGLAVVPPMAALVPVALAPEALAPLASLAGVAFEAVTHCAGGPSPGFRGNVLVTHRGLSGPAVLQVSSYWQFQSYRGGARSALTIDLLPGRDAADWLHERRDSRALVSTLLAEVVPRRFALEWCALQGVEKPANQLSARERRSLAHLLNAWTVMPSGTLGYAKAEVTLGGVDTACLSSKTMEAVSVPGLYFVGEVVDVTGWLGGYNFQWAWSSGWVAGQYV